MKYDNQSNIPHQYKDYPSAIRHSRNKTKAIFANEIHWHDSYELIFVKKGHLMITVRDIVQKVDAPALVFVPGGVLHAVSSEDLDYQYSWFQFYPSYFTNASQGSKEYLEPLKNREEYEICLKSPVITDEEVIAAAFQLDFTCGFFSKRNPLIAEGYLLALLGLLYENKHLVVKTRIKNPTSFAEVINYVEEHFTEDISVKSVAELFGYNESYFSHRFKELFGISFIKFITRRRLEYACKLMNTTKYTISECATLCGFSDSNYFSVCFKKKFNITPTEYIIMAQYKNQVY